MSFFDDHVNALEQARKRRREALAFRSAAETHEQDSATADAASQGEDAQEGLGVWLPGDTMQGQVNERTLLRLLARVDARGFERSAQQLEFHQARRSAPRVAGGRGAGGGGS